MKNVYLIGGTMGVGKTAVSQCLKEMLPNSVFLDGDWCWDASPFQVTDETKTMVLQNIRFLLNQFIHCSAYENVVFCWVMHQQGIIDTIVNGLDGEGCSVKTISLLCDEATLRARIEGDITSGKRDADVLERSVGRIPLYRALSTVKVDTTGKTVSEIASEIAKL